MKPLKQLKILKMMTDFTRPECLLEAWITHAFPGWIFDYFHQLSWTVFSGFTVSFALFSPVVPVWGNIPLLRVTRSVLIRSSNHSTALRQCSNHGIPLIRSSNHECAAERKRSSRRFARWKTSWKNWLERERSLNGRRSAKNRKPWMTSAVQTRSNTPDSL